MSPLGFKARVGCALFTLSRGVRYTYMLVHLLFTHNLEILGSGMYMYFLWSSNAHVYIDVYN